MSDDTAATEIDWQKQAAELELTCRVLSGLYRSATDDLDKAEAKLTDARASALEEAAKHAEEDAGRTTFQDFSNHAEAEKTGSRIGFNLRALASRVREGKA